MLTTDAATVSTTPRAQPPACAGPVARAWWLVRTGALRAASVELQLLLRSSADAALTPAQRALALLLQVDVRLATGEVAAAAALLDRLPTHPEGRAARAHAHGEVAAAYGDHGVSLEHFLAVGSTPEADEDLIRPWRVGASLALVRTGHRGEGATLAREQVELGEASRDPFALAHGLRALATATTGNDPVGLLRRAHGLAAASGSRRLTSQLETDIAALTLLGHGASPRATGATGTAETLRLLRHAEAYAAGEGLWPLHARVTALLARLGEEPRPLQRRALDVLTTAEQRVARLAGGGWTNREVAAELGVSVKGVEWHLSRVYRKLGIGSREDLATLLTASAPTG